MPFRIEITAEKPVLSSFRERWVKTQLARVEGSLALREDELQQNLRYGVSPAKIDQSQFELDALRDLKANLTNSLETIARQNYGVVTALDDSEDDETPIRIGGWRSQRAYLENLQRERNKLAPLSRDEFNLAKETSAKRSRRGRPIGVDLSADDVLRQQHPTWFTDNMSVKSYLYAKKTLTGVDPCEDAKRKRREVMFAQKTAGRGYHGKRVYNPC